MPSTGLVDNQQVTVTVTGHQPQYAPGYPVAEVSPLAGYPEPRPRTLPPPQVVPIGFLRTDAQGNGSATVNVRAEPNFNASDPNAQCPPTQEQPSYGLANCFVALSQSGTATIAAPITFANTPRPRLAH